MDNKRKKPQICWSLRARSSCAYFSPLVGLRRRTTNPRKEIVSRLRSTIRSRSCPVGNWLRTTASRMRISNNSMSYCHRRSKTFTPRTVTLRLTDLRQWHKRSQEHLRALKEEPLIELPPLRETLSSQEQKRLDTLDHRLREAFIWWWEGYLEAESYIEPGEVEFIVAQRRMVLGAFADRRA